PCWRWCCPAACAGSRSPWRWPTAWPTGSPIASAAASTRCATWPSSAWTTSPTERACGSAPSGPAAWPPCARPWPAADRAPHACAMTDTVRADTLIVGGGTAGCVLAARLSEDPAHTVTVLEAGRTWLDADAFPAALRDATRMPIGPEADWLWRYPAVLTAAGGDRVVTDLVRGRVLGGSSSVNGGYFARARPADFAAWDAVAGGPGWDFASAVAAYCRGESDRDFADRPGHGGAGPIPVVRAGDPVPVSRAFAAAARAVGLPEREDLNAAPGDGPDTGLARVPCNVVAGRRVGAAAAYLLPAAHRPNLRVLGEAEASRVLVRRGRAVGVEFRRGGAVETATAERVVLCAGAVESAALLLRSGIGTDADAISVGVPLVHPAPVGRWFTDHPEIGLDYRLDARPAGRPTVPLEYVVDLDDIELRPYTVRFTPGVHRLGIALMRPRSAGVLGLAAGDPARGGGPRPGGRRSRRTPAYRAPLPVRARRSGAIAGGRRAGGRIAGSTSRRARAHPGPRRRRSRGGRLAARAARHLPAPRGDLPDGCRGRRARRGRSRPAGS